MDYNINGYLRSVLIAFPKLLRLTKRKDCTLLVQSFLVVHFRDFIENEISNYEHDRDSGNT